MCGALVEWLSHELFHHFKQLKQASLDPGYDVCAQQLSTTTEPAENMVSRQTENCSVQLWVFENKKKT